MELAAPAYYPFGGLALARRLESAEAKDAAEFAEVWTRRNPQSGDAVINIGGGVIAFGGPGSPLSHAVGVGMQGPVSEADLGRIEEFYRSRETAPAIDLCPFADPSLSELLGKRGYRITEFNNVLVRPIGPDYEYRNASIARSSNEYVWARTVSAGFFEREDFTHEELELTALIFQMPAGVPWIATVEGEPAAAAGMAIQEKLALFFGDSTVKRFRGRGLHSALIQARLAYASAQGCDLATASTLPGSGSQANYERLGFRLVYTKLILSAALPD